MRKNGRYGARNNAGHQVERTGRKALISAGTERGCIRIISLCAYCKRFKDDGGAWLPLSHLMAWDIDVKFSHGICPACAESLYPELYEAVRLKRAVS